MRFLAPLALALAACGSGPSQTGDIGNCSGVTLTGPGAFVPLSGMAYQETANLGAGASAAGTFEVVMWSGPADGGGANASQQSNCSRLLAGAFSNEVAPFIAPQTFEFNLPDNFTAASTPTVFVDLTQPLTESSVALEDIVGTVSLSSHPGDTCLSGSFTANVKPVDTASGFAIDGGVVTPIYGTFSLPYCH